MPEDEHFRTMTPGADGLPVVGPTRRSLGAKIPDDIVPDANGEVHPGAGGMSTAPGSIWNLPHHRRPRGMGRGSTGPPGDWVFSATEGQLVNPALLVRRDPRRPAKHALVEPRHSMQLNRYQGALAATRPQWRRVWP